MLRSAVRAPCCWDGEEVRACVTPVSYAAGKQVTTIEGLPAVWAEKKGLSAADAGKTLHPVQQAWIDEQVPQCGYCQSGMMIATVQLLAKNPNPQGRSNSLRMSLTSGL
jgi:aerobic-type carbon monoxide dehydrogenase small subunit (CoxS/CutS family)